MADKSRRLTLKVQPELYEATADAGHARCQTIAEYTRQAVRERLKADGCSPSVTPSDNRLTGAQLLRLDADLRKLGIDLAQAIKE